MQLPYDHDYDGPPQITESEKDDSLVLSCINIPQFLTEKHHGNDVHNFVAIYTVASSHFAEN
jgi:hypothetical protein